MQDTIGESSVLYYPFSRCIDMPVLKQMLLVFETIYFCDPVPDEAWRNQLYRDLEAEDVRFRRNRDVARVIPSLLNTGTVRRIDPNTSETLQKDLTTDAILADLRDPEWMKAAGSPMKYGLPIQRNPTTNQPEWNVFKPKIPDGFADQLRNDVELRRHLIHDGGDEIAWSLSYAAGSSLGINTHLAIAEEFGLAPVTNSALHHQLMMMKHIRRPNRTRRKLVVSDQLADQLAQQAVMTILQQWLPRPGLDQLDVEQLIEFREQSKQLRAQFFLDIRAQVDSEVSGATESKVMRASTKISENVLKKANTYQAELKGLTDKLWPKLIGTLGSRTTMSGLGVALGASMIGSPLQTLIASIPVLVQPAKVLLEWSASRKNIMRKSSATVTYLSSVAKISAR